MILGRLEAFVAVVRVGLRIENHRINEQQTFEGARMTGGNLHQRVAAHGMTHADRLTQPEVLDQTAHIGGKRLPDIGRRLVAAPVPAHVDGKDVIAIAERRHHLIPAAGMEAGRMNEQHRLCRRLTPLEVGEIDAVGLELMLDGFRCHECRTANAQSRAW